MRVDEVPITPEKVLAALEGRYRAPRMPDVPLSRRRSIVPPLEPAAPAAVDRRRRGARCCACRRSATSRRATAREAARILADHGPDAMAVAGGTDLYPNMKRRQFTPKVLVGLRGLAGRRAASTPTAA